MDDPRKTHMTVTRRVLSYLRRKMDCKILFLASGKKSSNIKNILYSCENCCGHKVIRETPHITISSFLIHNLFDAQGNN